MSKCSNLKEKQKFCFKQVLQKAVTVSHFNCCGACSLDYSWLPLGEGLQGSRDKGVCTERTGVDFVLLITVQPPATSWVNKAMNSTVVACYSAMCALVTLSAPSQVPFFLPTAPLMLVLHMTPVSSYSTANHFLQTLHTEGTERCSHSKWARSYSAEVLWHCLDLDWWVSHLYFYCDFQLWWNQCT